MIHLSQVRKALNSGEPCDLSFWKKNGEIVHASNVVCTSSYFKNNTVNLKFLESDEFRKIKIYLIFQFNNQEVCI